jgi:colicin import membrane protein
MTAEAFREYRLPILLALLLHAAVIAVLVVRWGAAPREIREIRPQIVNATLVMMEAGMTAAPAPAARPQPKPEPKPAPRPEPQPQPKPEPPKPEPKPAPKPEPKPTPPKPDPAEEQRKQEEARRQEQERQQQEQRKQEELARQQRLETLADASFENALASEASELAAAVDTASSGTVTDAPAAMSYRDGIYQAVRNNWSRPPSARNGMETALLVELVPTGDVVNVTIVKSSGDAAFDRSAESAVRAARRFQVPPESDLFERYFRRFTLLFRPEDLLR